MRNRVKPFGFLYDYKGASKMSVCEYASCAATLWTLGSFDTWSLLIGAIVLSYQGLMDSLTYYGENI